MVRIALVGGTGGLGVGLALRLAKAGYEVLIGSRSREKAEAVAENVRKTLGGGKVVGDVNEEVVAKADVIILCIPFQYVTPVLKSIRGRLSRGKIVVSPVVPLATAIGGSPDETVTPWQGSAALLIKSLLPEGVSLVAAFHNVPAERLRNLSEPIDCDVFICGDDPKSKAVVAKIVSSIDGLRPIDVGELDASRIVEQITALLIRINKRYKVKGGVGIRVTYLET